MDYEYERNGTANIFMFTEPLGGRRHVSIRERKTSLDWAYEIRYLLEVHYPEAEYIRPVCDNLNTHTIDALYKAFPPKEARQLAKRLEIHHTPKHGSWLDIAEIELSALTLQCLDRPRHCATKPQPGQRDGTSSRKESTGNSQLKMLA